MGVTGVRDKEDKGDKEDKEEMPHAQYCEIQQNINFGKQGVGISFIG
ncbi:MAG: hypothetical protein ACHBN1_19800 [Heteroscytonema crispum UTEX LB 1556]